MSVAPEIGTSCFTSAMDWMDTRSSARHSRTTPTPPRNPAIRHLRETASWGAATVPCFTARARAPLPRQPRTGEHRARKSRRATAKLYYTFCTAAADARARADTPASLRGVQSHSESDSNIERERSKERRKKKSRPFRRAPANETDRRAELVLTGVVQCSAASGKCERDWRESSPTITHNLCADRPVCDLFLTQGCSARPPACLPDLAL